MHVIDSNETINTCIYIQTDAMENFLNLITEKREADVHT